MKKKAKMYERLMNALLTYHASPVFLDLTFEESREKLQGDKLSKLTDLLQLSRDCTFCQDLIC